MTNIKINDKTFSSVSEVSVEISKLLSSIQKNLHNEPLINEVQELLYGITLLSIEKENEFIYRGTLIKEIVDAMMKYQNQTKK